MIRTIRLPHDRGGELLPIVVGLALCGVAGGIGAALSLSSVGMDLVLSLVGVAAIAAACRLLRVSPVALAVLLIFAGYVIFNRSFADLHISVGQLPVYIGELLLLVSLPWVLANEVKNKRLLRRPMVLALGLWVAYGTLRLLAGGLDYGVDALRDSAIWYYGLFSLVGYALWPTVRRSTWTWFLIAVFSIQAIVTAIVTFTGNASLPLLGSDANTAPAFDRADVMAANLIGGATFFLLALRSARLQVVRMLVAMLQLGLVPLLQVRAASMGVVAVLAMIGIQRRWSTLAVIVMVPVIGLFVLDAVNPDLQSLRGELTPQTIVDRQLSTLPLVFEGGATTANPLTDTAAWRVYWWNSLYAETTSSTSSVLFGLGFGPNLIDYVGYNQPNLDLPLRSPHDILVTVFARTGLVGLVLWLGFLTGWSYSVFRGLRAGLRRGDQVGVDWLAWMLIYVIAILVVALFGVVLEGPYGAIPFYLLLGMALRLAEDLGANRRFRLTPLGAGAYGLSVYHHNRWVPLPVQGTLEELADRMNGELAAWADD
jgi:hypothetical protein